MTLKSTKIQVFLMNEGEVMVKYENECVGCPPEIGCFKTACPYTRVKHIYCDRCGAEGNIYQYGDEQLCIDCIEEILTEVK